MDMRIASCLALGSFLLVGGCSPEKQDGGKNMVTLETGVRLVRNQEPAQCRSEAIDEALAIRRTPSGYRVQVSSYFDCQDELEPPYLEPVRAGKTTLVIAPKRSWFGFHTLSECSQTLLIDIDGRLLKSGEMLYVVNDSSVVGHVQAP